MNLRVKISFFIGFAAVTVNCGSQNEGKNTVEAAKIENGAPKTAGGRIILSSRNEGPLICPETHCEGRAVIRTKMAKAIADKFNSISEISDIEFFDELYEMEVYRGLSTRIFASDYERGKMDIFTVSFTAYTTKGKFYKDIRCAASTWYYSDLGWRMTLEDCKSSTVELADDSLSLHLNDILFEPLESPGNAILD